jgi:hypothetical protein
MQIGSDLLKNAREKRKSQLLCTGCFVMRNGAFRESYEFFCMCFKNEGVDKIPYIFSIQSSSVFFFW